MVKALVRADAMSNTPNAHDVAEEVVSAWGINTEWREKLPIATDEWSWYTNVASEGVNMHTMRATMANSIYI